VTGIKEEVSWEAIHTVSAYPAAVDQSEDHRDELKLDEERRVEASGGNGGRFRKWGGE